MPVSAGIYNALNQPVRSVADYAADYDQADARKQAIQRNALMLQESQANMADRQRARMEGEAIRNRLQALGEGATPEARINALEATGLPQGFSQADALRKTLIEQRRGNATAAKDEAATEADRYKLTRTKLEHGVQWLQVAQSPQQAQQMYADGVQKGYWSMQDAQQQAQTIPQDPAQFAQWKQTQLAQILDAAKLLPNVQTRNTGGSTDTLAINPLTGVPTVTGSVRNTQTPDSVASNARMAADAAAGRAVQVRGQNLTDARARQTAEQSLTKPFEVAGPDGVPMLVQQDKQGNLRKVEGFGPKAGASKPMTEGQAKANLFGSRAQESNKILEQLAEGGTERPGAIKGIAEATGNILGLGTESMGGALSDVAGRATNWTQSAAQQQVDQAQRDFINAVLRRESGAVIGAGEFRNAEQQYFPQPGDSDAVKKQKARNRATAIQGILAEVPDSVRPKAQKNITVDW